MPGCIVKVGKFVGKVRFIAKKTPFSEKPVVGIELKEPNGKNDGSVHKRRYFKCKPKHMDEQKRKTEKTISWKFSKIKQGKF